MESFFRTHAYLVEHLKAPVRRDLMDEINWKDRMIGIKGARGVGKTTFLLQYAKSISHRTTIRVCTSTLTTFTSKTSALLNLPVSSIIQGAKYCSLTKCSNSQIGAFSCANAMTATLA